MNSKIISAFIKLMAIAIGFLSNFYLASILSKNDFGLFSALISLFSLCLIFSNMGMSLSILDLFPKVESKRNLLQLKNRIFVYSSAASLFVGFIAFLYAYKSDLISTETNLLLASMAIILIIFFQNIHASNIAALRSFQSFRTALSLESIIFSLTLVGFIYLLYLSWRIELIYAFFFATLITFILSTYFTVKKIHQFKDSVSQDNKKAYKTLSLSSLLPFLLLGFVEVITTNLDVLLVRELFGNEQTADYFIAKKMLIAFTFFWFIYNFIYTPKLSKLFSDRTNLDKNKVIYIIRLKWPVLFISTTFMLLINLFFYDIIGLFNLSHYANAKPFLMLFSVFAFIHILTGPVVSFLNVTGLSTYSPKVVSLGAVVFLISFYPLQYYFGVLGILIALNISLLAWKVLGVYIIQKETGFNLIVGSYVGE
ncbi:oligosaccharide flippase family protein [Thalassotalea ganghwensis]